MFCSHKWYHAFAYQALEWPCGIVAHFTGPWEGRRNDALMFNESGVHERWSAHVYHWNWAPRMYGDSGYGLWAYLVTPFEHLNLTDDERACNQTMSPIRQHIEWCFGRVTNRWRFGTDVSRQQVFSQRPVNEEYVACILLENFMTCLAGETGAAGNITSKFFDCRPPTLESYVAGTPIQS